MTGDRLMTGGGLEIRCSKRIIGGAVVALRPERVIIANGPIETADNSFPGEVEFVSYMGGLIDIHVRLSDVDRVIAQVPNHDGSILPLVGDRVYVGWSATAAIFPAGES
jgi:putative spermidine/putrescine transport system ATP-binding protein